MTMVPTLRLTHELRNGSRRARYLAILSPLLGALAILAFATSALNQPRQVSEWAADSFLPFLGHRRLYQPANVGQYLHCMKLMDSSDTDWDNSLDIDEYKDFSNKLADHYYGQQVGNVLPKELKDIFTDYAEKTDGKSNQIIDIYGSGVGEADSVEVAQLRMLDQLCQDTSSQIDAMFEAEHARVDPDAKEGAVGTSGTVSLYVYSSHKSVPLLF
jgi:hypothetical protein